MMKRKLLLLCFSAVFIINGYAKQRTEVDALAIATSFYANSSGLKNAGSNPELSFVCMDNAGMTRSANDRVYYYIYNKDNTGFVIISGDDRAIEILGYSDESAFDYASAPGNLKYWLNCYREEIKYLFSQPESPVVQTIELDSKTTKKATAFAANIQPLLGEIKWDQDAPYNYLCPKGTVTGCVATGMAQVMKYHNWPDRGEGAMSYKPQYYSELSVDFSQTAYDWANMLPTYGSSYTPAQRDAVATLMYHCGVAVNMNYDIPANGGSAASSFAMGAAMVKHFKYDAGMQLYFRDYYSRNEWRDMIKTELNASRPVLYSGNSTDVGHLFVCDGYDSNNLFHINWGWSGSSNGYFELSALNPSSLGIGGGNAGGFNFGQGITVGIQKRTAPPVISYVINGDYYDTPENTNRTGKFNLSLNNCYNLGITDIPGLQYRIELRNTNNELLTTIGDIFSAGDLLVQYGWPKLSPDNLSIPNTVSNGQYHLYITFKAAGQADFWAPRLKHGTPQYVNVEVTSGKLVFSLPTESMPSLTVNNFTVEGKLYQNKTGRFTVTVSNTGAGDYHSKLGIYLQSTANSSIEGLIMEDPVVIAAGETKTFDLQGTIDGAQFTAGSYYLAVMYDPQNNRDNIETVYQLGELQMVNILPEPTQMPTLSLVGTPAFANPSSIYRNNVEMKAQIKNTGGYYEGTAVVLVFENPYYDGYNLTSFGDIGAYIEKGETADITFKGAINLTPGTYNAVIFYENGNELEQLSNMIPFTLLGDSPSALSPIEAVETALFPNPAVDILYLKSEAIVKTIRISDLSGKQVLVIQPNTSSEIAIPVSNLSRGTYILQSVTDEGVTNYKFLKK